MQLRNMRKRVLSQLYCVPSFAVFEFEQLCQSQVQVMGSRIAQALPDN